MIRYDAGDVLASPAALIVNPVNTVGIMGKGLALQVRRRFPRACAEYVEACRNGTLTARTVLITPSAPPADTRLIAHLPTKRHWRDRSRLDDVAGGLEALAVAIATHRIASVAMPMIGCGLGALAWPAVHALIIAALHPTPESALDLRISGPEPQIRRAPQPR